MLCDDPGCTGIHGHDHPYSMWCPRTRAMQLERERRTWRSRRYLQHHIYKNKRLNRKDQEVLDASAEAQARLSTRRGGLRRPEADRDHPATPDADPA